MDGMRERASSASFWFHRGGAWPVIVVLAVFLLGYFPLQRISSARRSATADEPLHLTAGYVAWKYRDFRFDPTHPPLLRMWAAGALLGRVSRPVELTGIETADFAAWSDASLKYSSDFLFGGPDGAALLEGARFRIVVLGALLGVLIFAWVRECLGLVPAGLALGLYAMEPNLSGHATLVTTDLGVTCFIFGAVYFLWRTQRRYTVANLGGLALFSALAVVSKYSAILLGPILGLLLLVAVVRRTQITPRRALAVMVLVGTAGILAIWAVYGFRYDPSPAPGLLLHPGGIGILSPPVRVLAAVGSWIDAWHLLPNAYTQGFLLSQATAEALPAYLNGEVRAGGWWYYFPFAFLVKTPSVLLILAAAGLVGLLGPVRPDAPRPRAFVLLPVAVYLACAMASEINLGVRHILPVYPFVLCLAAVAMHELIQSRHLLARLVLAVALVFALVRFQSAWPGNLTFFNRFAGGPLNGARLLTDSNLDWGQHLKSLKRWMDVNHVRQINLAYAGTIDPESYGIQGTCLPGSPSYAGVTAPRLPGYVAISATVQSGVYLPEESRLLYAGFKDLVPVAIVGNSIRVYWVEDWPVPVPEAGAPESTLGRYARFADALLFEAQSPDFAMKYYRAYLSARPADSEIMARLGLALLMKGAPAEAHRVLQQAIQVAPHPARLSSEIVLALLSFGRSEEALAYARAAVERTPGDALAHDALGTALAFGGRDEEALAAFARSLELAPASSNARAHEEAIRRRLAAARPDLL
jgi:hypothetical protein